jgi:outer membrane protein OmpA-like peptidoglycan-associated protein
LKHLQANPSQTVLIESHKSSDSGRADDDQEITQTRGNAVAACLEALGIAVQRLQPKALGRSKPITDNDTPFEV